MKIQKVPILSVAYYEENTDGNKLFDKKGYLKLDDKCVGIKATILNGDEITGIYFKEDFSRKKETVYSKSINIRKGGTYRVMLEISVSGKRISTSEKEFYYVSRQKKQSPPCRFRGNK